MNEHIYNLPVTGFEFIVTKKQVHKNNTLFSEVLFNKVTHLANASVSLYGDTIYSKPVSFEMNMLKNAYLDDELILKNEITAVDHTAILVGITVLKKKAQHHDIICKASFGFAFKEAS